MVFIWRSGKAWPPEWCIIYRSNAPALECS